MKLSKELKAGLIALFAIVGFIYLFQFMKGRKVFSTDNFYYSNFDNVEGLQVSNPVSINGLKIGQVEEIKPMFLPSGGLYFKVKISADSEYSFSKKSTVEIFEPGIMSGKELRINIDTKGPIAQSGDVLQGAFKPSMLNSISSQVGPVKDQVQDVLVKMDTLLSNANSITDVRNQQEIRQLLLGLNRTIQSFESTAGRTSDLISNNDPRVKKILDNANLATLSARLAIDKYGRVAEQVDTKQLNNTIDKLNITADKLNNVVSKIERGEGSLGKLTNDEELYRNLNETSKNLNILVEDIKNNPKKYINISVFGKNAKS